MARHDPFELQNPLNLYKMTKQQLIEKVAAKTELAKSKVEVAVDSILELIAEALRSNEKVDLRGFGSFVVKDKKERQGRKLRLFAAVWPGHGAAEPQQGARSDRGRMAY